MKFIAFFHSTHFAAAAVSLVRSSSLSFWNWIPPAKATRSSKRNKSSIEASLRDDASLSINKNLLQKKAEKIQPKKLQQKRTLFTYNESLYLAASSLPADERQWKCSRAGLIDLFAAAASLSAARQFGTLWSSLARAFESSSVVFKFTVWASLGMLLLVDLRFTFKLRWRRREVAGITNITATSTLFTEKEQRARLSQHFARYSSQSCVDTTRRLHNGKTSLVCAQKNWFAYWLAIFSRWIA